MLTPGYDVNQNIDWLLAILHTLAFALQYNTSQFNVV